MDAAASHLLSRALVCPAVVHGRLRGYGICGHDSAVAETLQLPWRKLSTPKLQIQVSYEGSKLAICTAKFQGMGLRKFKPSLEHRHYAHPARPPCPSPTEFFYFPRIIKFANYEFIIAI